MHIIGKIDREIYSCVTTDIVTDDLIITEKQVLHIIKRHGKDFSGVDDIISSIREVVLNPDYIVESEIENTAFVLKELSTSTSKSRLIMRLKTSNDPENYKNSIITFQKIREKEWKRILRNKKTLYKSE